MSCIHRLAAHDNSVTSLQFDDQRIVSGGSDGRVKVWDLRTGTLVRELSTPAEAVWRVAFEDEKAVILASRAGRTIMEVSDYTFLLYFLQIGAAADSPIGIFVLAATGCFDGAVSRGLP